MVRLNARQLAWSREVAVVSLVQNNSPFRRVFLKTAPGRSASLRICIGWEVSHEQQARGKLQEAKES
jgi:hypothetical protein